MRIVLGILVGIVTLLVVGTALGWVATVQHPMSYTIELDTAGRAAWLASAPLTARLALVAGGLLGTLAGSYAALRISRSRAAGWIVAAAGLLLALPNFLLFSQPLWMQAAILAAPLLGGWLAMRLAAAPIATPAEP